MSGDLEWMPLPPPDKTLTFHTRVRRPDDPTQYLGRKGTGRPASPNEFNEFIAREAKKLHRFLEWEYLPPIDETTDAHLAVTNPQDGTKYLKNTIRNAPASLDDFREFIKTAPVFEMDNAGAMFFVMREKPPADPKMDREEFYAGLLYEIDRVFRGEMGEHPTKEVLSYVSGILAAYRTMRHLY